MKATVTVTADSADAGTGVASAQFQTSPAGTETWTNLGAADTVPPYSTSWNTTGFAAGLYDLRVITTDDIGLSFTSPTVTNVLVDNAAPTVSLALANGPVGAYLSAGKVYFKANAAGSFNLVATVTDTGSGPASATFPLSSAAGWTTHIAETDTTPAGGPYTSSNFAWSSGASAPAAYTVTGADALGNTATSAHHLHARLDGADRRGDRAGGGGERARFGGGDVELGRRRLGRGLGAVPDAHPPARERGPISAPPTPRPRTA